MDRKQSRNQGEQGNSRNEPVREGFGDDMGTRVGRPDPASADALDDRSVARLSEGADDRGLEGAILAGSDNPTGSAGQRGTESGARSSTRADGSSTEGTGRGETLDHTQRAESGTPERGALSGMGGEANQGVHGAQRDERAGQRAPGGARIERGTDEQGPSPDRSGSEPLRGRKSEHRPSYGGEGGAPRTSSDQREGGVDYYGDEGTGKKQ